MNNTGEFSLSEYFAFTEWVGYNYIRFNDCWVHRYADQRDLINYRSTDQLYVYWSKSIRSAKELIE